MTLPTRISLAALCVVFSFASWTEAVEFVFAPREDAARFLGAEDSFVRSLSRFDRQARLQTEREIQSPEYLEFVAAQALDWEPAGRQRIEAAIEANKVLIDRLAPLLPETLPLIRTTGAEEGGAAYTRENAIIFPKGRLRGPANASQRLFLHELFHVLSRHRPDLRDRFYRTIGYEPVEGFVFPRELEGRRLTNPDAPRIDHAIRVRVDSDPQWVMPILYADSDRYDTDRGGAFFAYLTFEFLVVDRDPKTKIARPLRDHEGLRLLAMEELEGFADQVGQNTGYLIHPEETLADHFVAWALDVAELPSPEPIERLDAVMGALIGVPTDNRTLD